MSRQLTRYHSICPIHNLSINSNLVLNNFQIFKNISKEDLETNHDIDFEIMNFLQKETWVKSPIYVRDFELVGDIDSLSTAFKEAGKQIQHFINSLTLFKPSFTYIDRGPLWVIPIPRPTNGESSKGDFYGIIETHESLELDTSEFSEFSSFFDTCWNFFSEEITTNLAKHIETAYYWLTKTRAALNPYDRLIFQITLIEALVGGGQELTHRISHRCATLLGKNSKERGDIYDMLKKYYGQRSTLLHGDTSQIANKDLNNLLEIGRTMILRFLSLSKSNYATTKSDLMDKLDRAVVDDEMRNNLLEKARLIFEQKSDPRLNF